MEEHASCRRSLCDEDADFAWLEQGKKIGVKKAPTHFGPWAYEIVSDVNHGRIAAAIEIPRRNPPKSVLVRFRHPKAAPIKSATVDESMVVVGCRALYFGRILA